VFVPQAWYEHGRVLKITCVSDLLDLSSSRQYGHKEGVKSLFEHGVRDADSPGVLYGRQRILDNKLDIEVRPYLMEVRSKVVLLGVGEHDKLHARGRLVVVQLVFAGAVGQKGVVFAPELLHHGAQREDQAVDQLLVVEFGHGPRAGRGRRRRLAIAGDAGARLWARTLSARRPGPRRPASAVDALGCCSLLAITIPIVIQDGLPTVTVEDVEGVEHHSAERGTGAGGGCNVWSAATCRGLMLFADASPVEAAAKELCSSEKAAPHASWPQARRQRCTFLFFSFLAAAFLLTDYTSLRQIDVGSPYLAIYQSHHVDGTSAASAHAGLRYENPRPRNLRQHDDARQSGYERGEAAAGPQVYVSADLLASCVSRSTQPR
jgi:hypothetical protein